MNVHLKQHDCSLACNTTARAHHPKSSRGGFHSKLPSVANCCVTVSVLYVNVNHEGSHLETPPEFACICLHIWGGGCMADAGQ